MKMILDGYAGSSKIELIISSGSFPDKNVQLKLEVMAGPNKGDSLFSFVNVADLKKAIRSL